MTSIKSQSNPNANSTIVNIEITPKRHGGWGSNRDASQHKTPMQCTPKAEDRSPRQAPYEES